MKKLKTLLTFVAVLLAVFLGLWIVQDNPAQTAVTLLGFPLLTLPLGLWILVFFGAGLALGLCLCYPAVFALQGKLKRSMRRERQLDDQLAEARDHPSSDA
ncbi:MAG TPA: hypothetical protein DCF62_00315 [Porticoccaceae bacterium]|nr:hypothetical protein [Porticoccaceae bacterium]HCO58844.1 hypothetical protein [Porticoccaceae bacterium]